MDERPQRAWVNDLEESTDEMNAPENPPIAMNVNEGATARMNIPERTIARINAPEGSTARMNAPEGSRMNATEVSPGITHRNHHRWDERSQRAIASVNAPREFG